jgi:hypothetical protein
MQQRRIGNRGALWSLIEQARRARDCHPSGRGATPMVSDDHDRLALLPPEDVARAVQFCLEPSPTALVRELMLERAAVAPVDPEIQETAPAWLQAL